MRKRLTLKNIAAAFMVTVMIFLSFSAFTYGASAVTPTYYVSNAYMKTQFYKNLTAYDLTGDERYDVVSIAFTQYGYHEGDDENDMSGTNRDGYKNFAEYNRMYGKLDNGEGNGLSYGYSWCAAFVSWCLRQARVPKTTVETFVSCSRAVNNFRTLGIFRERSSGYQPIAGDIIFFINPEYIAGGYVSSHVGLVVGCDGEYVYTIEGNTSSVAGVVSNGGCVKRKQYKLSSTYIYGYGRPAYKIEEKKETYSGKLPSLPLRGYFKFNPKTPNKIYDVGANVKLLQKFLNWALDTNLVVDGYYGINTGKAVCKFEKVCGINC